MAQQIPIEPPPQTVENKDLVDYLMRQLANINGAFAVVQHYSPRYTIPNKYSIGDLVYFGDSILPDITQEGLWLYKSTGWVQVS